MPLLTPTLPAVRSARKLASAIDVLNARVGVTMSYLVYVVMAIIAYEVSVRHLFNKPTPWVHDLSGWIQVFYIFLGGAWALQRGYFVRVDVFYSRFSPRLRACIDLFVGTALMTAFAWAMTTRGLDFGLTSYRLGEIPQHGAWDAPVWPSKMAIVAGMILLSLAWLARAIRSAIFLMEPPAVDEEQDSSSA